MKIEVFDTNDIDEFMKSDAFQKFNDQCKAYEDEVIKKAEEGLSEEELKEFRYYMAGNPSKNAKSKVRNALMYCISMGLG